MAWWQWGNPLAPHLVVCAHGLSRQGRDFDVLAQALVARSGGALRIACPDVVGRGRSDWLADPAQYQLPTYVGDMLAMLARLHSDSPVGTLDWVGTSMGGLIGLGLAATPGLPLPVPVRRMVMNDVGPVVQWEALERIGTYLGQTGRFDSIAQAAEAMRVISQTFGPHSQEEWLALSRAMVRPANGGGFTLHYDPAIAVPFRALTREMAASGQALLWQAWDSLAARVLITRGVESDLLTRETAAEMTRRRPGTQLVEFEGVGHAPTLVAGNQVEAVVSFLLAPEEGR